MIESKQRGATREEFVAGVRSREWVPSSLFALASSPLRPVHQCPLYSRRRIRPSRKVKAVENSRECCWMDGYVANGLWRKHNAY